MAYQKQNFQNGQVITADHLNYMEDGIAAASIITEEQRAEIIDAVLTEICRCLGTKV